MKNIDTLVKLVVDSDLNQIQKNILSGFIERMSQDQEQKSKDRLLVEEVAGEKRLSEIVLSNDNVKIYTVYSNGKSKDVKEDWDVMYPYRSIFLNSKGVWERSNTVSPTLDLAYLVYLEKKHLGLNSQFTSFASKMLGIDMY